MKIKEIKETAKPAQFQVGDFFLTHVGSLRRFIMVDGCVTVLDVSDGTQAAGIKERTASAAAKEYVRVNGPIEKVEVDEINYFKTNQRLERE